MILQRIMIIVGDAGFEPGTSAPEAWCANNEPQKLANLYFSKYYYWFCQQCCRAGAGRSRYFLAGAGVKIRLLAPAPP